MDTSTFAKKLQDSSTCPAAALWTSRYLEMVATETLRLSWQINDLPADLRKEYWEALSEALRTLPPTSKIRVTVGLREHLEEHAQTTLNNSGSEHNLMELIENRTYAMPLA